MGTNNIIYVGGTFDLLHSGHINLFKRAKKLGRVIVSLNTDEFAARYKRKPFIPLEERMAVIQELCCVDGVIVNTGDEDSKPALLVSGANLIVHGDDWTGDSLMKQMGLTNRWLQQQKIKMMYLSYTKGISTTQLSKEIKIHV